MAKYSDYIDVFSTDLVMELPKNTGMNKHIIKLIEEKKPLYKSIYTFSLMKQETLKANTKTCLKTAFIQSFKSPADALIFFNKKPNSSLYLYINYQGLNNLMIKNRYFLPLIVEFFNRLSLVKWFPQLDLTNTYY